MDDALYIAASGMKAIERMLDNSAHNAVNSQTPGYRNHKLVMKSFGSHLSDVEGRENLIGSFETVVHEQGSLRPADTPFAMALEGDGFFVVQDAKGNSYHTRNGDFTVSVDGELVTRAGYQVVGDDNLPLRIDPRGGQVTVTDDGTMQQGEAAIGKVKVVEFAAADLERLQVVGETLFRAPAAVREQPGAGTLVRHGFLEMPKYGGTKGLVEMVMASKNYDAMQKTMRMLARTRETLIRSMG